MISSSHAFPLSSLSSAEEGAPQLLAMDPLATVGFLLFSCTPRRYLHLVPLATQDGRDNSSLAAAGKPLSQTCQHEIAVF